MYLAVLPLCCIYRSKEIVDESKQMSFTGNSEVLRANYSVLIVPRECMSKLSWYTGNAKELDQAFFFFFLVESS